MKLNELIKALESMLPDKVSYGDLIGAEGVYAHSGPLVYEDPEPYFVEQAIAELKKLSEIQDILGPVYDTDHLRELIEADKAGRCVVLPSGGFTDKDGENALKSAMNTCLYRNNAVTRYIADAVAEKLTREEAEAALEKMKEN